MQTGDDNIIKLSNINSADWELKMTISFVYNPPEFFMDLMVIKYSWHATHTLSLPVLQNNAFSICSKIC